MRRQLIEKLGGFPDVNAALDSIKDSKDKYAILTTAVKRLFNTVGPEDILKENSSGQMMYEGKIMTVGEKVLIMAEAKQLIESRLWKILQDDIKYQANRKMFILAENEMQLAAGKFWLYTLDAIKTRLSSLTKGSGHYNTKEIDSSK